MANFLDSGHKDINCIAKGSSSLPNDLIFGFSNILAVFNLYNTCNVPALASQNFILPSACLKKNKNKIKEIETKKKQTKLIVF